MDCVEAGCWQADIRGKSQLRISTATADAGKVAQGLPLHKLPGHAPPGVPQVKYEPAAPVGNTPSAGLTGQDKKEEPLFPHLDGTIDYEAVAQELPVHRGGDGTYLSIAGL